MSVPTRIRNRRDARGGGARNQPQGNDDRRCAGCRVAAMDVSDWTCPECGARKEEFEIVEA
ncbi:MAG: hypothetical protein AMXMBFR52_04620 [Burkholderiales bacterium]